MTIDKNAVVQKWKAKSKSGAKNVGCFSFVLDFISLGKCKSIKDYCELQHNNGSNLELHCAIVCVCVCAAQLAEQIVVRRIH